MPSYLVILSYLVIPSHLVIPNYLVIVSYLVIPGYLVIPSYLVTLNKTQNNRHCENCKHVHFYSQHFDHEFKSSSEECHVFTKPTILS